MKNITLNLNHESNWLLQSPLKSVIDLIDFKNKKENKNNNKIPKKNSFLNNNSFFELNHK